jgi:hypothetical protein
VSYFPCIGWFIFSSSAEGASEMFHLVPGLNFRNDMSSEVQSSLLDRLSGRCKSCTSSGHVICIVSSCWRPFNLPITYPKYRVTFKKYIFPQLVKKICGSKRDEVTGNWRKQHNEELHSLYSSPSIIRLIKSRRMRWEWHIARMRIKRIHIGYWCESQKDRDH